MQQLTIDEVRASIALHPGRAPTSDPADDIAATHALARGHFSLHDGRHTPYAIRFRALARDSAALTRVAKAVVAAATWGWADVTVVSPDTAGFLLGDEIRRQVQRPHAIVQTDLGRRATRRLMSGAVATPLAVIVNDVSVTGDSLETLHEVVRDAGARLIGVAVFAAIDAGAFVRRCYDLGAAATHLVDARWIPSPSGSATCDGCRRGEPLIPIAEFA